MPEGQVQIDPDQIRSFIKDARAALKDITEGNKEVTNLDTLFKDVIAEHVHPDSGKSNPPILDESVAAFTGTTQSIRTGADILAEGVNKDIEALEVMLQNLEANDEEAAASIKIEEV